MSDVVAAHHAQHLGRVERTEQQVGAAVQPGRQEEVARGVRDRPRVADHTVSFEVRQPVIPVAAVHQPVVLGVTDALWTARRTRRMPDDVPVVRSDLHHRVLARLGGQPLLIAIIAINHVLQGADLVLQPRHIGQVVTVGDQHFHLCLLEHLAVRQAPVASVQRHAHGAGDGAAEKQIGGAQIVVFEARHPVAWLDAQIDEPIRQAHASIPHLAEGQLAVFGDDRPAVGVELHGLAHQAWHVHSGSLDSETLGAE